MSDLGLFVLTMGVGLFGVVVGWCVRGSIDEKPMYSDDDLNQTDQRE